MKTEAMFRRLYDLPTSWARRHQITRPENGVNSVPTPDALPFGGVLSTGPETKPFQNWYRDRCAGMGRPLGVVKSEQCDMKTLKGNYKKLKDMAAMKMEGGPGSGRYPAGSHQTGDRVIDTKTGRIATVMHVDRTSNTTTIQHDRYGKEKTHAPIVRRSDDVKLQRHMSGRFTNVIDKGAMRIAASFKATQVQPHTAAWKKILRSEGIQLADVPSTSYFIKAAKTPMNRKLTDLEKASVKKLTGIYKKLKVEGGPGSGRYPAGSGRIRGTTTMRLNVSREPRAKRSVTQTLRMNRWVRKMGKINAMEGIQRVMMRGQNPKTEGGPGSGRYPVGSKAYRINTKINASIRLAKTIVKIRQAQARARAR